MKYSDQLKSYEWQKKIMDVKYHYDNQCQMCFDKDAYMQVHHPFYDNTRKIWEYNVNELVLLCPVCHTFIHEEENKEYVIKLSNEINCNATEFLILLHRLRHINPIQAIKQITSQIITEEEI